MRNTTGGHSSYPFLPLNSVSKEVIRQPKGESMNHQSIAKYGILLMLIALFLVGCNAPAPSGATLGSQL